LVTICFDTSTPEEGPLEMEHRVEHLFGRYEALVNPLERLGIAKNRRVSKKAGQSPP
jgi:hypothetical protein